MKQPWELDLATMSEAVASRLLLPTEILASFLQRIDAFDDTLRAFITVTKEAAQKSAARADATVNRSQSHGPLFGLPIGHKDVLCTAGTRTTAGSLRLKDWIPNRDATAVARLAQAGMINLGKLNTHEFAYGATNKVSSHGATRNPWDTSRTTGGSSGGSAAAVAAGLLPAATGTDTGGSVRAPSACCGLTGLKPTYGRISRYGVIPLSWSLDHVGIIARTVFDAAMLLEALAGPDPLDPTSANLPVPPYVEKLSGGIEGVKIGVPRRMFFSQAQDEVVDTVDAAIGTLRSLGARTVEVEIPDIEKYRAASLAIVLAEAADYHADKLRTESHLYSDEICEYIELGDHVLAKDYVRAQRYRQMLGESMRVVLNDADYLIMPTVPILAPRLDEDSCQIGQKTESVDTALLRNTEPFNLTGLPALALPCGFSHGLPVSLQIVGRPFDEAGVLRLGHAYQVSTDWHAARPDLSNLTSAGTKPFTASMRTPS